MKSDRIPLADHLLKQGRKEEIKSCRIEFIENMFRKDLDIELICDIMEISRDYEKTALKKMK